MRTGASALRVSVRTGASRSGCPCGRGIRAPGVRASVEFGLGDQFFGGVPFSGQAVDVAAVGVAVFGIDGIFVAGRAACGKCAGRKVRAGDRSIWNAVAVNVQIAAEFAFELFERLRHRLVAVGLCIELRCKVCVDMAIAVIHSRCQQFLFINDRLHTGHLLAEEIELLVRSGPCRGHNCGCRPMTSGSVTWSFIPRSRSVMTMTGVCRRSVRSKASAVISKHSFGDAGNSSGCFVSPCEA